MNCLLIFLYILNFLALSIESQQEYSGNSVLNCNNTDQNAPSSSFLYSYNGENSSCRAFLIFRAQFPYNSVPIIATLTSSNQSEIAKINNVTRLTVFPEGTEVIIPVNCTRSGQYYQAITKYNIPIPNQTFFTIANNTYQGLSTCDTLKRIGQGIVLEPGFDLEIPLRCACPTKKQAANGIKNLLTYTVTWGDNVQEISKSFNTSINILADANGFLEETQTIFPFTTILVPMLSEPQSRVNCTRCHYRPIILPRPVSETPRKRSKRNLLIGGIAAAGSFLLLFPIVFLIVSVFRKRLGKDEKGEKIDTWPQDIHGQIARIDKGIKIFKYEELKKATGNFGSRRRIKGCVYRGVINKEVVAIKKMSKEAYKEANLLSRINHFNLIKLRGYCEHQGHLFLVFEYMKNGSLREWLSRNGTKRTERLLQRIQIALDIANGLLYLHNFAKPAYVHKNINSSNILLDSNLRAKISNFGFTSAIEEIITPEYIRTGIVTTKVDVYSFGVVLLELITGKDAVKIAAIFGENGTNGLRNILDPDLGEMEYAFQVVNLSLRCLMQNQENRPNMDDIVSSLIKIQRNVQKSDQILFH